jgi:hypothetical protein
MLLTTTAARRYRGLGDGRGFVRAAAGRATA